MNVLALILGIIAAVIAIMDISRTKFGSLLPWAVLALALIPIFSYFDIAIT